MNQDLALRPPRARKLIAIAHADMVGYSRLIGNDDAGTVKRLRILRRALIDPAIREHGGRIVKTAGDALLIAFESIEGAVRCAIKIQQNVPAYDGDQRADRAMRFRVGINICDAISDGDDLHGDGVNVAARLQAECPVGGVCVSRSVRDHVRGELQSQFEEIGTLNLKNIPHPVDAFVFRATTGNASAPGEVHERAAVRTSPEEKSGTPSARRLFFPVLGAILVGLAIGIIVSRSWATDGSSVVWLAFAAAIAAGLIGSWTWMIDWRRPGGPARFTADGDLIKVFGKSNDFLATGDKFQLPSLLKDTKREAWFVGSTFYISVGQYRALILSKLAEGVDINFLILDPYGTAVGMMARLLGVTREELVLDCMSGIRVLKRTNDDARSGKSAGALRIKLLDQPFQTRFYIFDPKSKNGVTFFVPQINGTNSQTIPGFLVRNSMAAYSREYFASVLAIWNDAGALTLEEWSAKNPHAS